MPEKISEVYQLTREDILALIKEGQRSVIEEYIEAKKETPVTKEVIMQKLGIKDKRTFYSLRRKKGIVEAGRIGNAPTYLPSQFSLH